MQNLSLLSFTKLLYTLTVLCIAITLFGSLVTSVYQNLALLCWAEACPRNKIDHLLEKSLEWNRDNQRARYWLARSLLTQERTADAFQLLEQIPQAQQDASTVYARITAYEQLGRYSEAYANYLWLAEHSMFKNSPWRALLLQADAAFAAEQWEIAKEAYRLALARYPANQPIPQTLYHYLLYARQHQHEADSLNHAENITDLYKKMYYCVELSDFTCADSIARGLEADHQTDETLTAIQLAQLAFVRGQQNQHQQNWSAAINYHELARKQAPHFLPPYRELVRLYTELKQPAQVQVVEQELGQLIPQVAVDRVQLGTWRLTGLDLIDEIEIAEGGLVTANLYWQRIEGSGTATTTETRQLRNLIANAGFEWSTPVTNGAIPVGYKNGIQPSWSEVGTIGVNQGDSNSYLVLANQAHSSSDLFSWPITVTPGHPYLVVGKLRVDEAGIGAAYLGIYWHELNTTQPSIANWIIPGAKSQQWATVAGVLQAPDQAMSASLWLMNASQPQGKVFFDNLVVAELTTPQE